MINNKYLLWPLLLIATVFCVTWTFNHINAWAGILVGIAIVFAANSYFKPKNRE